MRPPIPLLLVALAMSQGRAESIAVLARDLSTKSPNVAAEYPAFDNLTLCVGRNGFMEWVVDVDGGRYFVHFYHCSAERRPCRLLVNGEEIDGDVLDRTTGGWMTSHLQWRTYGPFELPRGRNTIRLAASGFMPHLKGLALSTRPRPPDGDVFGELERRSRVPPLSELSRLRASIEYLLRAYAPTYTVGKKHLARLEALEERLRRDAARASEVAEELEKLRGDALLSSNPLFDFEHVLFVKRYTSQANHYYTDYINGCRFFGGNICRLSLAEGTVTDLVPELRGGIFGRFDLSFDGRRVVFGYKKATGEGFRIWEVGVDGHGLRQLTHEPPDERSRIEKYKIDEAYPHHTDDMHPCYLPDGGICFISTRCERGILCDPPDLFTTTALYRMDPGGGNLQVLSESPLSEASPSVMNDGRILYTRWEYVDKPDVVIKCLWAMHPDGTGSTEVFGNDITFPDSLLHGRAIPGHDGLFVAIGAPHMPLGVGTVLRIDTTYPIRTRQPMTYITPDTDIRSEHGYYHKVSGRWVRDDKGPLYTDAYPLDERSFLVSCNPDRPFNDIRAFGLYLLDEFGSRVLIHQDEEISCWQPVPLRPRHRPPVLCRDGSGHEGPTTTITMLDVYQGLEGVARGTIKYLRVLETVPRPWAARRFWDGDSRYQQHAVVSMNGSLHVKRLLGIVPVEEDGSAYFFVPPETNLFFQALDEEFMEVQRMRTFINLRRGEKRSCIGCHEPRKWAPVNRPPQATRRPPVRLAAQPGDTAPRPIHYVSDVQPILDRHCVRCHNPENTEGEIDVSGELTTLFNRSYESLLSSDFVQVFHENEPKTGDASPVPPYSLGSHVSRLVELIREGHEGVKLSREEFVRVVTWIDANSPYYGSYFGRRNLKYRGHPDFRPLPK